MTRTTAWLCLCCLLLGCGGNGRDTPGKNTESARKAAETSAAPAREPASTETFPAHPERKAVFQGSWYPGNADELKKVLGSLLGKAPRVKRPPDKKPRIIIAPHAGYVFAWKTAARAFKQIEGRRYDLVVLIGPCHRYPLRGVSVYRKGSYVNCLGALRVHARAAERLIAEYPFISFVPTAHAREHCLEILLPFIQVTLGNGVPILPVLVSETEGGVPARLARALAAVTRDMDTLFVVSTDLAHYPAADDARRVDARTVESWQSLDPARIRRTAETQLKAGVPGLECTMCGEAAVLTGFELAKLKRIGDIVITGRANSADAGPRSPDHTVGYASAVLFETVSSSTSHHHAGTKGKAMTDDFLDDEAKRELLRIARRSVEAAVSHKPVPEPHSDNPRLRAKAGCFVTLKNKGRLRGCIGCFESDEPLYRTVSRYAVLSATRDYRFFADPVTPAEVPRLTIEISVLTPIRRISDPYKEIVLGKHGIFIRKGARSGTYLPQVATEHKMNLEEFLSSCCAHKAGLPPTAWKDDPEVEIYVYEAIVFSEEELK